MENDNNLKQFVASLGLSKTVWEEITALATACNSYENIAIKYNPNTLRARSNEEINDFLCYADGQLVGFLGIFQFNSKEVEISGMVHPDYRRQGIFQDLLKLAEREIIRRGIRKLIFIKASHSKSGDAFLQNIDANYQFSEHWMKLASNPSPKPENVPLIRLRQAVTTDIPFCSHVTALSFAVDEEDTIKHMTEHFGKQSRFVIECIDPNSTHGQNGTAVGTIAIGYTEGNEAFIFGFCILPDYQGKGYGRQALQAAVQDAKSRQCETIELEVACENTGALSLYESCGFEVLRANDYYVKELTDEA